MQKDTVTRVIVWSRWLRFSHWTLTISVFGLLATGWMMIQAPLFFPSAQDYHHIFSAVLIPAFLLRCYLLFFGKGTDHLRDCELDRHRIRQALEVIRFYLTLGRVPLPNWYGHNPLWGPIYLIFFLFLVLSAVSGLLLTNSFADFANISMHDLHRISYYMIAWFVFLHLPAVFCHDLYNKCADVSGMINGYRVFRVVGNIPRPAYPEVVVSVDTLLKSRK